MEAGLNRRDLFKALTAAAFTTLQLPAAEPNAPLFFTKEQFALLDTLTELIIPTDAHSPGAHQAGVAAFIDRTVAESFRPEDKTSWRNGLAAIDELSRKMHDNRLSSKAANTIKRLCSPSSPAPKSIPRRPRRNSSLSLRRRPRSRITRLLSASTRTLNTRGTSFSSSLSDMTPPSPAAKRRLVSADKKSPSRRACVAGRFLRRSGSPPYHSLYSGWGIDARP